MEAIKIAASKVFNYIIAEGLVKTDASDIDSAWIPVTGFKTKRLTIINSLDQAVDVSVYWRGPNWQQGVLVGSKATIASNTGVTIKNESDTTLTALSMINGEISIKIEPAGVPTTGDLTVYLDMIP